MITDEHGNRMYFLLERTHSTLITHSWAVGDCLCRCGCGHPFCKYYTCPEDKKTCQTYIWYQILHGREKIK